MESAALHDARVAYSSLDITLEIGVLDGTEEIDAFLASLKG